MKEWWSVQTYLLAWIGRVWFYQLRRLRGDTVNSARIGLALRATIALALDRDDSTVGTQCGDSEPAAWQDLGCYWTDYGTGYAFAELRIDGFRYRVIEDGTL